MRVPLSWLTEVLQRSTPDWSATPADVDAAFVRVGFEIEEVVALGEVTGPLVVGRVAQIEELTEFRKPIRYCQVEVGEAEPYGIVCGARNFAEGDLVVVALPGAELPGGFQIASRETYGKVSNGMICSVAELGIGNDHSGILVLEDSAAQPGDDARAVLGTDDTAIDVNVTPDRGYAFSIRGLARELAASYDLAFEDPGAVNAPGLAGTPGGPEASIDADSEATQYCLQVVRGIDPGARTPWWMVKRLLIAGIRPISAPVDITNYVMIELGQPMHAFDAAKVSGPIVVRSAGDGATLRTLDEVDRTLDPTDVVIADATGPIALAGVMGGAATEVGIDTTDVLLESATFSPVRVFRTSKRCKLTSEASKRFERIVDPAIAPVALARATQLFVEICGGTPDASMTRAGGEYTCPTIVFPADAPDRTAGVHYPAGTSRARLEQVGCSVSGTDELLTVTPPSWRPDLTMKADLVEEVLRLEGLEDIPSVVPRAPGGRGLTAAQVRRRSVGKTLAAAGFVEVLPFPFMPSGVFDTWGLDQSDPRRDTVLVLNPLEADRPELNTTLLPGLLEMVSRNIARGQRDLALYAVGQVVLGGNNIRPIPALPVDRRPTDEQIADLVDSVPRQPLHVAAVLTGAREQAGPWGSGRSADAADAFEMARLVGDASGHPVTLRAAQHDPWHPGRCAQVLVTDADGADIVVGWAGELHPAVLERSNLPARTCAVEINLDAIPIRNDLAAPQLSPYPAVLQDVAVVVDVEVPAEDVRVALRDGAGELLETITLFDVFAGEQLGEGKKSLAFSLRFRARDRTLTEDEASAARDAAVQAANAAVGAVLR